MRLIIVSNRLPLIIQDHDPNTPFKRGIGGLVTGMESYLKNIGKDNALFQEYLWFGWPGTFVEESNEQQCTDHYIKNYNLCPVFLNEKIIDEYYNDFCNKTLWPLFHYFPNLVNEDLQSWESYQRANELFYQAIKPHLRKDDVVWIQDYHLMLLPDLIRQGFPRAIISYFLHIPFPAFDIFRRLPKAICNRLLSGLLGADLIGFHTFGYAQDFLQCVSKVLKHKSEHNMIHLNGRNVKVDIFPMGVDYKGIQEVALSEPCVTKKKQINSHFQGRKVILSVDRLDYTKGIMNRLIAFDLFLSQFPQWREKVVLILVVAPSRRDIDTYQQIKRSIDEWVGKINGSHGTNNWVPIIYHYKQFDLVELCALYGASDIALVTPLRDGMNLIAKEYVVAHVDKKGMLILSEMAGAINELKDAVAVNPFSEQEFVDAIQTALTMDEDEMLYRNNRMHKRLQHYDVIRWAHEIMDGTLCSKISKAIGYARILDDETRKGILEEYNNARSCLFIFDYDGTLSPFVKHSTQAKPSTGLKEMLKKISLRKGNKIVIISGRDRATLEEWFEGCEISFSAELGAWVKNGEDWKMLQAFDREWKKTVRPVLDKYVSKLPFSFIEEKECALVWDYRLAEPDLRNLRIGELRDELQFNSQTNPHPHLDVLCGDNSFIVRNIGSNKADAVAHWLNKKNKYDFILAIGDDDTDEELFSALPAEANTLHVGGNRTRAKFYTLEQRNVYHFLQHF